METKTNIFPLIVETRHFVFWPLQVINNFQNAQLFHQYQKAVLIKGFHSTSSSTK